MFRRFAAVLAAAIIPAAALAATIPAAHAAIPATVIALPALDTSSANPLGLTLNASNWAGTGNSGTCSTGAAVVNDAIAMWKASTAGCASDFQIVPNTSPAGSFEIEYNPNGNTSAALCVSVISGQGTIARLRPCSFTGSNIWQTFHTVPANTDITGGVLIEAGTGFYLNDKAYGGNGSPVISWTSTTHVNGVWASVAGPGLPA